MGEAKTHVIACTYFDADAEDDGVEDVTSFWDRVHQQDEEAVERQQVGLSSPGARPPTYTDVEEGAEAVARMARGARGRFCGIFGKPVTATVTDGTSQTTTEKFCVAAGGSPDSDANGTPDVCEGAPPPPPPPPGTTTYDPATAGADITLSGGNLTVSGTAPQCGGGVVATTSRATGRWYWEVTATQDGGSSAAQCPVVIGIQSTSGSNLLGWYGYTEDLFQKGIDTATACTGAPTTISSGDVIGVAYDADAGTLELRQNSTVVWTCAVPVGDYFPYANQCNDGIYHCAATTSFSSSSLVYTPPAGYSTLP